MNTIEVTSIFKNFEAIAPDFTVVHLTSGHINHTFLVQNNQKQYILQKVNTSIFKNLAIITLNIKIISKHLQSKLYPYKILTPLVFQSGDYLHDKSWRIFEYLKDTQIFEKVQSKEQAYEAAKFLSLFHFYLKDIDLNNIQDSIDGFTNFNSRILHFEIALQNALPERLLTAKAEIEAIHHQYNIFEQWNNIVKRMPKRLIHADPKISNFLFHKNSSSEIKALIDWDTFMCGTILYDFGDMVRSYTNLRAEDDAENYNNFSFENYLALKEGFLFYLKDELEPIEIENFELIAQMVILIQAIRFLTDYLNHDKYYIIHYPEQNLNRTRNQLNLLHEMNKILSKNKV